MTQQIQDTVVIGPASYALLGFQRNTKVSPCAKMTYRNKDLFDPARYGLNPVNSNSSNVRGYILEFKLIEQMLALNKLTISANDAADISIEGIKSEYRTDYGYVYDVMNMKLEHVTGTLVVGKDYKFPQTFGLIPKITSYRTVQAIRVSGGRVIIVDDWSDYITRMANEGDGDVEVKVQAAFSKIFKRPEPL